jgi:hypothetical protein
VHRVEAAEGGAIEDARLRRIGDVDEHERLRAARDDVGVARRVGGER